MCYMIGKDWSIMTGIHHLPLAILLLCMHPVDCRLPTYGVEQTADFHPTACDVNEQGFDSNSIQQHNVARLKLIYGYT